VEGLSHGERTGATVTNPRTAERRRIRRTELLDAARRVFVDRGYFETRVADIVAAAGCSQGTFYLYFTSKDDVLHALLEVLVEDLYAASLAPRPRPEEPIRALEATIRQFMHAYRDRAGLIRILEQVASFSPDFLTLRLEIKSRFTALIEAGVRGQGHAGAGRPDARYLAQALGAMVEDMAYTSYVLAAPLDEQEAVSTMAFIWLQAVGAGAPLPTS